MKNNTELFPSCGQKRQPSVGDTYLDLKDDKFPLEE